MTRYFLAPALAACAGTALLVSVSVARTQQDVPEVPEAPAPSTAPATAPARSMDPAPSTDAESGPELPAELLERARALAAQESPAAANPAAGAGAGPVSESLPQVLRALDYDHYRLIDFRPAASWWHGEGGFELQFFHRGYLYETPVALRERTDEACTPIPYRAEMFDLGVLEGVAGFDPAQLPGDFGFAGFSVYAPTEEPGEFAEVASFLGASYFRLCGFGAAWGGSFRGLAIGTGQAEGEEFPTFVEHWIQRPEPGARALTIYSLLDSPSVVGAYALRLTPGREVRADVSVTLFPRRDVGKVGIAPLTSMFFHGENGAPVPDDYRPEVHDSDGLAAVTPEGRHLWRPLSNPPERHRVTRYELTSPRGFGLAQRDRDFASYEDLESHFERRPSLWVEPRGDWGSGAIELIEIPTDTEFHDNVVAFWSPDSGLEKGRELHLEYKLLATAEPVGPERRVLATRRSRLPAGGTRFHVDFRDPAVAQAVRGVPADELPIASFAGSQVEVTPVSVQPNPTTGTWRVVFDVLEAPKEDRTLRLRLQMLEGDVDTWSASSEEWTTLLLAEGRP